MFLCRKISVVVIPQRELSRDLLELRQRLEADEER